MCTRLAFCRALGECWNIPFRDELFLNLLLLLTCGQSSGILLYILLEEVGHFQKMNVSPPKRRTIAEIASKAGVSIPTVSRVLNNRPDVAPGTRERVEQAIKESRCIRRREVNGLRKENNSIIDVLVTDLSVLLKLKLCKVPGQAGT